MLEEHLTSQERDQLMLMLDREWDALGGRGIPAWYAYILPTASFFLNAFNIFHSGPFSLSAQVLGVVLMSASSSFVISTLVVRRGLLLGGSGRSCYFPGAILGPGAYATEKCIFEPISVDAREIPIDIFAVALTFSIQPLLVKIQFEVSQRLSMILSLPPVSQIEYLKMAWFYLVIMICLCSLVYYRRTRLNRM
jgi:hypothetical protein